VIVMRTRKSTGKTRLGSPTTGRPATTVARGREAT
jgi:hypothetical protein